MADTNITIDQVRLQKVVATVLDDPTARLGEWQARSLKGGLDGANSLQLINGQAQLADGARHWSLVLKTITYDPANLNSVQAVHDNLREVQFYQSNISDAFSEELAAPRCYQAEQHGNQTQLWLEFIPNEQPEYWDTTHYERAAYLLGRFNGAYLAGKPLPSQPWLARCLTRSYAGLAAPMLQDLPELRRLPFFQHSYHSLSDEFFLNAWAQREKFFRALESLPQTLSHQDAFDGNLMWRCGDDGEEHLVALDWSFVGLAAPGEDLSPLVAMARPIPGEQKFTYLEFLLQRYQAGLADAGYRADTDQVRIACFTSLIYRYLFGATLGETWPHLRHAEMHPFMAELFVVPDIQLLFDALADHNAFYLECYRQAEKLLG